MLKELTTHVADDLKGERHEALNPVTDILVKLDVVEELSPYAQERVRRPRMEPVDGGASDENMGVASFDHDDAIEHMISTAGHDNSSQAWELSVGDLKKDIWSSRGHALPLKMQMEEVAPEVLLNWDGVPHRLVRTNGNGSCAIHAVFGHPMLSIAGDRLLHS